MPYPTEHSARLEEPADFKPDTYKRVDGGLLWGRVKVPKTIAIISAKLKDKCKPKDPHIAQSLRFPIKNWTASEAKAWLKKNKVDYILFEPAKKSKDKQSEHQGERKVKVEMTAETFAAEYPDVFEQVTAKAKAEGEKAATERFNQLRELAGDDHAFCIEQFQRGGSIDEAKVALIDRLRRQIDSINQG